MSNSFAIDTSPTKSLLVSHLTRDATTEACIFDLIDNSIDAARDSIYAKTKKATDRDRLPSSYSGYVINLALSGETIEIQDNCGGMNLASLSQANLRFGQPSSHDYGIGLYGVGLNRAIFKLGNNTLLVTESKGGRVKLEIDRSEYLQNEESWDIVGKSQAKTGKTGTTIKITNLDIPISQQAADSDWCARLISETEKRYARFLEKTLLIKINGEYISPNLVKVRKDGPFPPFSKSFKLDDETTVFIEAGQHNDHRFSAEPDYQSNVNRELSDQYGWSIICNDRVIVHLDTSQKTGWVKKWHNEFNGFVGYVYFTSKNPKRLPWNTPKTDIDPNHAGFQAVLKDMQAFTERWRNQANEAKKKKRAGDTLKPQSEKALAAKPPQPTLAEIVQKEGRKKVAIKENQTHQPFVLPADIDEGNCQDKLLQLVHEGKTVNIFYTRYAALALIRMLFETSARIFLTRHKNYTICFSNVIEKRELQQGRLLTAKEKKEVTPTLDELIWLFTEDPTLWLDGAGKSMNRSLVKFSSYKERMNSAIHDTYQVINILEALQIRDECLPMLRRLIER